MSGEQQIPGGTRDEAQGAEADVEDALLTEIAEMRERVLGPDETYGSHDNRQRGALRHVLRKRGAAPEEVRRRLAVLEERAKRDVAQGKDWYVPDARGLARRWDELRAPPEGRGRASGGDDVPPPAAHAQVPPGPPPMEAPGWEQVVEHLGMRIGADDFAAWGESLYPIEARDGWVVLAGCPSTFFRRRILERYRDVVRAAVQQVFPDAVEIKVQVSAPHPPTPSPSNGEGVNGGETEAA